MALSGGCPDSVRYGRTVAASSRSDHQDALGRRNRRLSRGASYGLPSGRSFQVQVGQRDFDGVHAIHLSLHLVARCAVDVREYAGWQSGPL